MKKEEQWLRLLEWILQELESEFTRIQKQREAEEEFFLALMEEIQRVLNQQ